MTQQNGTNLKGDGVGIVQTQTYTPSLPQGGLALENGARLSRIDIAYETYGTLSESKDNAIFICHALTGDAHVAGFHEGDEKPGWWDGMVGPGRGIDTSKFFVICANILGGCKGTTGPGSIDPGKNAPYGSSFPNISIADIVSVHKLLIDHLGIARLYAIVGGSFGGMQAVEYAIRYPDSVERCICIASGASLTSQALAFDIVGRAAIIEDPNWRGGDYYDGTPPLVGLSQARKLAHITYLSSELMKKKFGRRTREMQERAAEEYAQAAHQPFEIESYLNHQGRKFTKRFDANSYLKITQAMDLYDLVKQHGSLAVAFSGAKAKFMFVALSGDWLFLPSQSEEMVTAMISIGKPVTYYRMDAPAGHDAFLTHITQLVTAIDAFLKAEPVRDRAQALSGVPEEESMAYEKIDEMVPKTARRVLDLGCGDGVLLNLLSCSRENFVGAGVDFDFDESIHALRSGNNMLLEDIDSGLRLIPKGSCDCVVLSETLQCMKRPVNVVESMLDIAPVGIVSFPNFGHWLIRLRLAVTGRMPHSRRLPHEWYDTPNIHLCTYKDFLALCEEKGYVVEQTTFMCTLKLSKFLVRIGMPNLGASRVIIRIRRK